MYIYIYIYIYVRASRGGAQRPLRIFRSTRPRERKCSVAPPLRKPYVRKSSASSPAAVTSAFHILRSCWILLLSNLSPGLSPDKY